MCGRYYRDFDLQQMAEHFRAEAAEGDFLPSPPAYNIAPTTLQPVIRESPALIREIVPMRWGLVGHNTAGPDPKRSTFNARAESIERSPLWRRPLHSRRCLVPLGGFYEWRKPERTPFRFGIREAAAFALAGLWDAWRNPADGSLLESFAIITCEANELMAPIHDRMPVILQPRDYDSWLLPFPDAPPPINLLRPYDAHAMTIALAHPKVGNVRNQSPDMLNSQ